MSTNTISNEQFLFSCIKNSNGGTVNWQGVADQCGIVTKAAAAIKFKRMKEKFCTVSKKTAAAPAEDGSPAPADDEVEKPKKTKKAPAKKSTAKKRKVKDEDDGKVDKVKAEEADDSN